MESSDTSTGDNDAVPSTPPLPPDRPDLAERYGVGTRPWKSRAPLAIVGLVIVALVAATLVGLAQRSTGVQAGVLTYGEITESSITITVEVVRDPQQPVVCDVAAVGENQIDVGAERIEVPTGGDRRVVVSTPIETASPPLAARLLACRPVGAASG
jgi:hypothetical protein